MTMSEDDDKQAPSIALVSSSPPHYHGYSIDSTSMASSISSCSRHIKGWDERTSSSRQHLQEGLNKESGSDNLSNNTTLGLVNRKGLGMELVASPVLLAKHSEWNGDGTSWGRNWNVEIEVDGSVATPLTNRFDDTDSVNINELDLAMNTTKSSVKSLSHSDGSNHGHSSTSFTTLPTSNGEKKHEKYPMGQVDATPTRAQPAIMAALSMMRGQSDESPKGVEELTLERYIEGQDSSITCNNNDHSDDESKDNGTPKDGKTNGDKSSNDEMREDIYTTIHSRNSSPEKMPSFLSTLRQRRNGVRRKSQNVFMQELPRNNTDDENIGMDFEPRNMIFAGGDMEKFTNEATDEILAQTDHKKRELLVQVDHGMNDSTSAPPGKNDPHATMSDDSCGWDKQIQRVGVKEEEDINDMEQVGTHTNVETLFSEKCTLREVGTEFTEHEANDVLFPSCFSTLCDNLALSDDGTLEGKKAHVYSESLPDLHEPSLLAMDHSVMSDIEGNPNFIIGKSEVPSCAEELTLSDYLQLKMDGSVVRNTEIGEGNKIKDEYPSIEVGNGNQVLRKANDVRQSNDTINEKNEDQSDEADSTHIAQKSRYSVLKMLRRRKIGGVTSSTTPDIAQQNLDSTTPSVYKDAVPDSKHDVIRGGVNGKIYDDEMKRNHQFIHEVDHTATAGCLPLDNLFCNSCGNFNSSQADRVVGKDSGRKKVGRLQKRREKQSMMKQKSKDLRPSKKIEESDGLRQSMTKDADFRSEENEVAVKNTDTQNLSKTDGDSVDRDEDPVVSCLGGVVDKEFVGDVMDAAGNAAIIVLKGVRDVLDIIDDKINGCLEDDNMDDESESSSVKHESYNDEEDASSNVYMLPDSKTSKTTELDVMESAKISFPEPRRKLFSKFLRRKGGISL